MVVESKNVEGNDNGTPLLLVSLLLLLAGIVAFYYFSEIRLFYRVLGLFAVLGLAGYIIYQTNFGKTVYTYVLESKIELKKVSWPTKQETTQTAIGVIVIVVIIGILLWLLDMLLAWSIGTLYGVR
jgi:preprotein translocase subunit SecE|tara:strand:+ start:1063 stop:1440 length:378 start_codon:yes stop_codon:yes gene_type:complete